MLAPAFVVFLAAASWAACSSANPAAQTPAAPTAPAATQSAASAPATPAATNPAAATQNPSPAASQPGAKAATTATPDPEGPIPSILLDTCDWRLVGPFRGGRVAAVAGVQGNRDTYFFGATGGGVWKTTDAGASWKNVSDGFFGGSIGAVAVAPSNADIVYVGGGEKTWRGNVSSGDGIYKSTDAGATWTFCGLPDSRHISRIRIDPKNQDRVFAAVMGHVSGPNEERGVYRSLDGGTSWERVLFVNADAGAVDLTFAPDDTQTLYATTWRARRLPWRFDSGGDGSAIHKSTDGGTTWTDISKNKGLPEGPLGIAGIACAKSKPQRLYAQIEAKEGGLFRSDDAGVTWTKVNDERSLRQRAWYYSRVYVDPKDADTVYALNVGFHKSTDGGKTFSQIAVPHGDNHDLWIDPIDPQRMIEGNDGGACVSVDGGRSWTGQNNQPTAQFYRVTTDTAAPYRIYGAQQDNSAMRIKHRAMGDGIARGDFESTAGAESGWLAPSPVDPEVVFGGNYGGMLERRDHRLRLSRRVDVWPDNPLGAGASSTRYRFQWNFPIVFSPHDPNLLYAAGNVLFSSRDEGHTWQSISPDLTRNDPDKQVSSGGPITQDNTSVEYYCTIFSFAESRVQKGLLWCGSDDGLVHVSRDGGGAWANVTPKGLPEWAQINCIEADPFDAGTCYVAATRYKLDDFAPYLFVTRDYGASWQSCTRGIDPHWFVRCVRADPVQKGLLFCGTERTVWMSMDGGKQWQRLQRNLPLVPITDLCIKDSSLIAATQGRSMWSFDYLPHLRQCNAAQAQQKVVLFAPVPHVQFPGTDGDVAGKGKNPSAAPVVRVLVGGDASEPVACAHRLEIVDHEGKVVWTRDSAAEKDADKLALKRGMNTIRWDYESKDAKGFDGMVLWNGDLSGPRSQAPGRYEAKLVFDGETFMAPLVIEKDPRAEATVEDLQQRYAFVVRCRDTITKAHEAIAKIRSLRTQIDDVAMRIDDEAKKKELADVGKAAKDALTAVEETLYQTQSKSSQDPLNYPIKLTDKLAGVMSAANNALFAPTRAQRDVADMLIAAIDAELVKFEAAKAGPVAEFNVAARRMETPYVK